MLLRAVLTLHTRMLLELRVSARFSAGGHVSICPERMPAALGSFNCMWKKGDLGEAFTMDQSSLSCQSEAFSMTQFSSHQTSLC